MNSDNNKLISVIIPTHNRSGMLKRAIDSALRQTYKNIEIIVVDDGSTDDTKDTVEYYCAAFNNIKYIKNATALGACNARNKGIELAKGEFVSGLDDDDEFTPDRIENLVKCYNDDYAFVCSDIIVIVTSGSYILTSKEYISFNDLLWGNIAGSQVLVRRERMLSLNSFNENLPSGQDWDMWLRLTKKYGQAKRVKEALYIMHTEHEEQRITTSSKRKKGYLMVYKTYKTFMSKQQKVYRSISLKREDQKKVPIAWILALCPSKYFFHELRSIISKKLPLIRQFKLFVINNIKSIKVLDKDD